MRLYVCPVFHPQNNLLQLGEICYRRYTNSCYAYSLWMTFICWEYFSYKNMYSFIVFFKYVNKKNFKIKTDLNKTQVLGNLHIFIKWTVFEKCAEAQFEHTKWCSVL